MCYSIMIEQDLKSLEFNFSASINHGAFDRYQTLCQKKPNKLRPIDTNPRIYPNYFAPAIVTNKGERCILPMRYRLRPNGSKEEVPSKFNMFNARLDALETRNSWRPLFMRLHGIIVIKSFFEWVIDQNGKKTVVEFFSPSHQFQPVPILYDTWMNPEKTEAFGSFAVITTEAPKEIAALGHSRCPIILSKRHIDPWLHPDKYNKAEIIKALQEPETINFQWRHAVP